MLRQFVIIGIIFLSGIAEVHAQGLKKANGKVRGKSYSYYVMRPPQVARGIVLLMPSRSQVPKKLSGIRRSPDSWPLKVLSSLFRRRTTLDYVTATEGARAAVSTPCLLVRGFLSGRGLHSWNIADPRRSGNVGRTPDSGRVRQEKGIKFFFN